MVHGCQRDGVHKPGSLGETVDSLLSNKFIRLLVEFRAQIPMRRSAMGESASTNANQPDGDLAQQVILFLQLLHLALPYGLVIRFEEVLFHLMPRAYVLPPERDANPIKR